MTLNFSLFVYNIRIFFVCWKKILKIVFVPADEIHVVVLDFIDVF